jgi:predicted nucleotidyltransferase
VLRPVLACRWILKNQTPPPMLFSELMDACLDEALVPEVEELLRLKMLTPEIGMGKRRDVINNYLDESIAQIEETVRNLPDSHQDHWPELNRLFLKMLNMDK